MFHRPVVRREHELLLWALASLVAAILVHLIASRLAGYPAPSPSPDNASQAIFIVSPWDGIFFAGDYLGGRPHLELGQEVTPETIVGTVESMDHMYTLRANVWGRIAAILVEDGSWHRCLYLATSAESLSINDSTLIPLPIAANSSMTSASARS
jgi:hypothetical protein